MIAHKTTRTQVKPRIPKGFKSSMEIFNDMMDEIPQRLWLSQSIYDKRVELVMDYLNRFQEFNWISPYTKHVKEILDGDFDE
jgi:hypothetical protein